MAAKEIGVRLGKVVGWSAATLYKGGEMLIAATGDVGEGFGEGLAEGWENRCDAMDQLVLERQAKREAKLAQMAKLRAENASARRTNKAASAA